MPKWTTLYHSTPYAMVYVALGMRKASENRPEKCPKCGEDVYCRSGFKYHLERSHPADVLHKRLLKTTHDDLRISQVKEGVIGSK